MLRRRVIELRSASGLPVLLGVFAHPDDEQFGTAGALLACAERGISVRIATATSGGAGEISAPALATPETLADVREGELRDACAILGFAEPIFLRYPDGRLADVDPDRLRDDVVGLLRRLQPRVVLTFDANGAYGHPDHVAIHRATVAAMATAGDPSVRPELGAPHIPDKLYATAYPRSKLARSQEDFVRHGLPPIDFGSVQGVPGDAIGTPDERVTTVVDVARWWPRRWESLKAHRTQYGANSPFLRLPEEVVRSWLLTDCFVRLHPRPAPGAPQPDEVDLWQGLPLPGE
jgi:N-acetyl-1-D-myo-inositol-2-amino-2-deoxy-alpha-D-glucopyranoside deacetylase